MDNVRRPNPDKLLENIQKDEEYSKRGKLKIFLGYVAGVGKTYSMLEAAHQRLEDGLDVVVGYVETHGRKETESLLSGLEVIPRREIEYRGIKLNEMDLDAVLKRHPQLVLVDELAHTNIPGSRHPKRYQDVEEILNAGINVYSTVNIQHLESLSDVVQQITSVQVREKIPDKIVDEANEIELVDLPTDELLQRLKDGKVYISDQAVHALEKFFRKGNLTALRELSLRRAADRVDSQMLNYMQTKEIPGPWPATERILVSLSSHPMGERLIRTGRKLADDLNAEWHVVFVETPYHLKMPVENQMRLQHFLNLAKELGAKVETISGDNVADAVIFYAHEHNITKIVAGKPYRARWFEVLRGSVIDQIIRESGSIDVNVVSDLPSSPAFSIRKREGHHLALWRYALGLLLIFAVTLFGKLTHQYLDPANLVMFFLLAVVVAALYLGRGPAILTSIFGVLAFDFFLVNPIFSFSVNDTQYIVTFLGLLIVGLIISNSAALLRDQVAVLRNKEKSTRALFSLSQELTGATSLEQVLEVALNDISVILSHKCAILLPEGNTLVRKLSSEGFDFDENDMALAEWVFKNGQPAGKGTDTLPSAASVFVPLNTRPGIVGVIGIDNRANPNQLTNEQRMILDGLANLLAQAIERVNLVQAATESEMLRKTEKLQTTLLNSISHELRTPLASITGVLSSLADSERTSDPNFKLDAATRIDLIDSASNQARQLNRLLENLLDMTRLEAGSVHLHLEHCDMQDLVGTVLQQFSSRLSEHPIHLEIPDGLPEIRCDSMLIAQVLTNLLENACKFSRAGDPIIIGMSKLDESIELYVRDQGIGLPDEDLQKVFLKFYRSPQHKNVSGTGLGLSICKGIVEIHGGWIKAERNPDSGLTFRFSLPLNLAINE